MRACQDHNQRSDVAQNFGRILDFRRFHALQEPENRIERSDFVETLVAVEGVVHAEDLQFMGCIAQSANLLKDFVGAQRAASGHIKDGFREIEIALIDFEHQPTREPFARHADEIAILMQFFGQASRRSDHGFRAESARRPVQADRAGQRRSSLSLCGIVRSAANSRVGLVVKLHLNDVEFAVIWVCCRDADSTTSAVAKSSAGNMTVCPS